MELSGKGAGWRMASAHDVRWQYLGGLRWAGPGYDGVQVFTPEGERIGQILLPEPCANICFGGNETQPAVYDRRASRSMRSTWRPAARTSAECATTGRPLPRCWEKPSLHVEISPRLGVLRGQRHSGGQTSIALGVRAF